LQDRLERVMEENVWLQSELDEQRIQSDEQIQRLRDEIRGTEKRIWEKRRDEVQRSKLKFVLILFMLRFETGNIYYGKEERYQARGTQSFLLFRSIHTLYIFLI
jgi:hypothetical protein